MKVIPFKKGLETKVASLIVDAYDNFKYDFMGMIPKKLLKHNRKMFNAEHVLKKANGSEMFLCVSDNEEEIYGVACLEGNEIHTCYTRGDLQKNGIGRFLMKYIEEIARKRKIKNFALVRMSIQNPFMKSADLN